MTDPEQVPADAPEALAAADDGADVASPESSGALRGTLETNADANNLHDMGGNIGPADDTARGDDPGARP